MIKIEYINEPPTTTTSIGPKFENAQVIADKSIIVDISAQGKSAVFISLRVTSKPNLSVGSNFIPSGSEKFLFREKTEMNFFSGSAVTRTFFKLTKKQGLSQLEEHLLNIISYMFKPEGDFTVYVWESAPIRMLRQQDNRP